MKNFQNNCHYYSYPYYSGCRIFIFYEQANTYRDSKGLKAEQLTDKIQTAINQKLGILPCCSLALQKTVLERKAA
jgi:hypothetical protein